MKLAPVSLFDSPSATSGIGWRSFNTPLGVLVLTAASGCLTSANFERLEQNPDFMDDSKESAAVLDRAQSQLEEYFLGTRRDFDLPLNLRGTEFQTRVWNQLLKLGYGQVCSYGELAQSLGQPGASRAVGLANGKNPISIIVPCHRVIGANGSLTGYASGIERKQWLLNHECR